MIYKVVYRYEIQALIYRYHIQGGLWKKFKIYHKDMIFKVDYRYDKNGCMVVFIYNV